MRTHIKLRGHSIKIICFLVPVSTCHCKLKQSTRCHTAWTLCHPTSLNVTLETENLRTKSPPKHRCSYYTSLCLCWMLEAYFNCLFFGLRSDRLSRALSVLMGRVSRNDCTHQQQWKQQGKDGQGNGYSSSDENSVFIKICLVIGCTILPYFFVIMFQIFLKSFLQW